MFAPFLCCSLLLAAATADSDQIQTGLATAEITPPVPYRMSGYFSERLSTGTKDPLLAKAVVFRQGDRWASLVFCDLIGIAPDVSTEARLQASRQTGIPISNIAIAATHSHTGPLYFGALRDHFHARSLKQLGSDPHERTNYADSLVATLVDVIGRAQAAVQPVRLRAGYAEQPQLAFNRRFHMQDGTVRFNPGQLNPRIIGVAGPTDQQVGIVSLSHGARTSPDAAIVSFALHLDTVGGTEYSADYPKYLQDQLRKKFGGNFQSLFGAGTCGDINHVDVKIRGRRGAAEIGEILGHTVATRIPDLPPVSRPSLAMASTTIDVALQQFTETEIAQAAHDMQQVDSADLPFLDRVRAYKIQAVQKRKGTSLPIEVQALRLSSDVAIVLLPGEVFVELGLAIKAASPFATTLVVELTNDAPGYIPTKKAFAEGSYETVNSRIDTGGGEAMVRAAIRLLEQLSDH